MTVQRGLWSCTGLRNHTEWLQNHVMRVTMIMNYCKITAVFLCCVAAGGLLYAQNADSAESDNGTVPNAETVELPETAARLKVFPVFSEGAACGFITRIVQQQDRSNFVFSDMLVGAYIQMTSRNMQPIDSFLRLTVYYPLSFTFNKVPYSAKNVIRYSADVFAGVQIPFSMWNVVNFQFSPGIHFNFQNADRFNYILLGAGAMLSMELPLARRWTFILDGTASYDYANLGTNGDIEPYDAAWMYQLSCGVRYSKKSTNSYYYIK